VITIIYDSKTTDDQRFTKEYDGLSTDTKPLYADGARNADTFFEMDTKKAYKFDQENDQWLVL